MTEFATKYLLSFIEAYEISEEKQREITEAIKAIENEGVLVDNLFLKYDYSFLFFLLLYITSGNTP